MGRAGRGRGVHDQSKYSVFAIHPNDRAGVNCIFHSFWLPLHSIHKKSKQQLGTHCCSVLCILRSTLSLRRLVLGNNRRNYYCADVYPVEKVSPEVYSNKIIFSKRAMEQASRQSNSVWCSGVVRYFYLAGLGAINFR